ncbi:hypothetical protein BH10PSE8_BH10PSE8_06770 [soil metagenome]
MNMHILAAQTRQMRRARAVYGALRTGQPKSPRVKSSRASAQPTRGFMLAETAALAAFAIAAAGIIALRAWFAIG